METALSASPAWLRLAKRYIWWQTPEEALRMPHRVMAQVMNLGTLPDLGILRELIGDNGLRQVLVEASPGEFSNRSWHFWHQVLGGPGLVEIPPLPQRQFA